MAGLVFWEELVQKCRQGNVSRVRQVKAERVRSIHSAQGHLELQCAIRWWQVVALGIGAAFIHQLRCDVLTRIPPPAPLAPDRLEDLKDDPALGRETALLFLKDPLDF